MVEPAQRSGLRLKTFGIMDLTDTQHWNGKRLRHGAGGSQRPNILTAPCVMVLARKGSAAK